MTGFQLNLSAIDDARSAAADKAKFLFATDGLYSENGVASPTTLEGSTPGIALKGLELQ